MKLISNTGVEIELIPLKTPKKSSRKLIDPIYTSIPGILRYLTAILAKRADLAYIFGKDVDQILMSLKNWGLVTSVSTYYSLTNLGEKYYEIIKNKEFKIFNELN